MSNGNGNGNGETAPKMSLVKTPCIVTTKLIALLRVGKVGDVLTDERLSEVCGKRTTPRYKGKDSGYGNLQSAIRYCLRNYSLLWGRIRQADCIKCLSSNETVSVVDTEVKSIYHRAKRTMKKAAVVKLDDLTVADRSRFLTQIAVAGTVMVETSAATQQKLLSRGVSKPLDVAKLLEAYKQTE